MKRNILKLIGLALILCNAQRLYAGGCHLEEVTHSKDLASAYMHEELRNRVLEIEKEMNAKGVDMQVVMIARSGSSMDGFQILKDDPKKPLQDYLNDLAGDSDRRKAAYSPEKLQYSHAGFLVKRNWNQKDTDPKVKDWVYMTHLLAECDKKTDRYGQSRIYFETMKRFFWDTKILDENDKSRKAMIIVPSPELQAGILRVLKNGNLSELGLHERRYNVIAPPFLLNGLKQKEPFVSHYQTFDQNSNQWPIEVIAAAMRPENAVQNRIQAQDVLWAENYRPTLATPVGKKERWACSMTNGLFWDATNLLFCGAQSHRKQKIYQVITVNSLFHFLDYGKNLLYTSGMPNGTFEFTADIKAVQKAETDGRAWDCTDRVERELNAAADRGASGEVSVNVDCNNLGESHGNSRDPRNQPDPRRPLGMGYEGRPPR